MKKLLFITLFFSAFVACKKEEKKAAKSIAEAKPTVKIMPIVVDTIAKEVTYTASLEAFEVNHVASSMPGRIENVKVEIGDRVRKGQLLVSMDASQLLQAKATLSNLKLDFQRLDTLLKSNTIAKQKYDQMETQVTVAKTNVDFLQKNTYLKAPFSGIITDKYFENGELFGGAPNTKTGNVAIVTLMQMNKLKAFINVSERYFPIVKKGMTMTFLSDIFPNQKFEGEVYRVHPTIDNTSRTFQVEVAVNNADLTLRPGMFGRVSLKLGEASAMMVPSSSILKLQGSNIRYVFLNNKGVAKRVEVELGKRFDDKVEILSNELHANDQLVVAGQGKLNDKMAIEVK